MPKQVWGGGVTPDAIDNAEVNRNEPYDGPVPPHGLYCWRVKVLKQVKSSNNNPQLLIGLELVPRKSRPDEKQYANYFLTDYLPVTPGTEFRYKPFLDAIGVSGREFVNGTKLGPADNRGGFPIEKIGRWVHDGKQLVMAQMGNVPDKAGNPRNGILTSAYWPTPDKAGAQSARRTQPEPEPEPDDYGDDAGTGSDDYDADAPF